MSNTEILLTIKLQQQLFADPKRIGLLKAVIETGSISQAAKKVKVSYKSAWDHLNMMDELSPKPLFERSTGGKKGGGTVPTTYAKRLIQLYDLLAYTQEKAFAILQDEQISLESLLSATARFSLQSSARNQFFGQVARLQPQGAHIRVDIGLDGFSAPIVASITTESAERLQLQLGKDVMLMIKAPWLSVHLSKPHSLNCFAACVQASQQKGEHQALVLLLENQTACYATVSPKPHFQAGQDVWVSIDPEQIVLLTL